MARGCVGLGLSPNAISILSIVFAGLGAAGLVISAHATPPVRVALLAGTVLWIALRSLANMLDGMVAVEHGRASPSGVVFNEFPDRVSDALLLAGAGYAAGGHPHAIELGWLVAVLAVATAYTRALGAASGAGQDFSGPMAKPARMGLLALGSVAGAIEAGMAGSVWSLVITLALIAVGCIVTIARRLRGIVRTLETGA